MMNMKKIVSHKGVDREMRKKSYRAPILVEFGEVKKLTTGGTGQTGEIHAHQKHKRT